MTAALLNTHVRDNLLAGFPTDAVWTTWSPSYTNLTVGNGTVVARYIQVGKLVVARFSLTLGSTSSVGSSPTVSMPVTAVSMSVDLPLGPAGLVDAGTGVFKGVARSASTTTFGIMVHNASGTYLTTVDISATVPFTWTTNDILQFTAAYEAA